MAVIGQLVTVGTTATLLSKNSSFSDTINYNLKGQSVLIQNPSTTVSVYLGGSNVTSSVYGHKLSPEQSISIDLDTGEQIYGAVASGTQQVNVILKGV